jgi:translation initiation factor 3 subunit B
MYSENYLVTYCYEQNANAAEAITVWSVRQASKLRAFELKHPLDPKFYVQATVLDEIKPKKGEDPTIVKKVERTSRFRVVSYDRNNHFTVSEGSNTFDKVPQDKVTALQNPNVMKWSGDGRFLARQGCDAIQVYELPHMGLLEKKSLAAPGVMDFSWSPRGALMSYWSPASGNLPAQVNIISLPERKDVSTRRVFDVLDVHQMVWQNDGDYFCVVMSKQQGKKPKTYLLILFRIKDSGVPVENLELSEAVTHVSFEPSGDRLVIVQGDPKNPTITFYSMSAHKGGVKEIAPIHTIKDVQCSEVIWSPAGGIAALVLFQSDNCFFNLFDVDSLTSLAVRRHERCTRLLWDPSGRTLATFYTTPIRQSHVRAQAEDGYNIWSFQGALICAVKKDKLFRFAWRPRPANVLSPEDKIKVIKNIKKYEKIFDKEDHKKKNELKVELEAKKRQISQSFMTLLTQRKAENAVLRARRVALKNGYDSDDDSNYNIIQKVLLF